MQSHKTFPVGVLIRMARWPMAILGSVQIDMKRSSASSGLRLLLYLGNVDAFKAPRVVKCWPVGGTNCRAVIDDSQLVRHFVGITQISVIRTVVTNMAICENVRILFLELGATSCADKQLISGW